MIYLHPDDNTTEKQVAVAQELVDKAFEIIQELAGKSGVWRTDFDIIELMLYDASRKIESIKFAEAA